MTLAKKIILTIAVIFLGISIFQFTLAYEEGVQQEIAKCLGKNDNFIKEECIKQLAIREKDETICDKLIGKCPYHLNHPIYGARDSCYYWVALEKNNEAICEKIKDETRKNSCFKSLIFKSKNPTDCERFKDLTTKNSCYEDYAVRNNDPFICLKIEGSEDNCYYDIIKRHGGKTSICDKIQDSNLKLRCKMHSDFRFNSFWLFRLFLAILSILAYGGTVFGLYQLLKSVKFRKFYSENSGLAIFTASAIGAIYYIGFLTLLVVLAYSFSEKLHFLENIILFLPLGLVLLKTPLSLWIYGWLPAFIYGGLITNIFLTKNRKAKKKLIIILIIIGILGIGFNFLLLSMAG